MNMKNNIVNMQKHKRRKILICVTGLSPQIVTETLYALCTQTPTPWIPDEVHLITTQRGADNARMMLLSDAPGWFHRLLKDWNFPPILFDENHIEVIKSKDGQVLNDIRDDLDNQQAADSISDFVRRLTEDDDCEIHASIAGGRKTMGFFLGYAMSLWGRPQDCLSHVLVSSPFEGRPEFFYPTPQPCIIPARAPGQDPLDASKATVWLGDIPFVRLRSLLPGTLHNSEGGFASTVQAANLALDQVKIIITPGARSLSINGQSIQLPPMQMSIFVLLAWHCLNNLPAVTAPSKEVDDPQWRKKTLAVLHQALGKMQIPPSVDQWLNTAEPSGDRFSQQLSKLEKRLADSSILPLRRLIARSNLGAGKRQRTYRLEVNPENIQILPP
jgi:CRISPR-associated protein (TIGR02584 family)